MVWLLVTQFIFVVVLFNVNAYTTTRLPPCFPGINTSSQEYTATQPHRHTHTHGHGYRTVGAYLLSWVKEGECNYTNTYTQFKERQSHSPVVLHQSQTNQVAIILKGNQIKKLLTPYVSIVRSCFGAIFHLKLQGTSGVHGDDFIDHAAVPSYY